MPRNSIQFQPGLSLHAFLERYGSEEQCHEALCKLRWPQGFSCPRCSHTRCCRITRGTYQCYRCRHQCSVTAGTIFHGSKLPLRTWFLAIYLLTQRKKGVSAMQLARDLGVSYNSAYTLKHKLLQVMAERGEDERLQGRIEIDDAYLGGQRPGKHGRGAAGKVAFLAAVQTTDDGRPLYLKLRRVRGFTSAAMRDYASRNLAPGSHIVSDGLRCFRAFAEKETYTHEPLVTGSGREAAQHPAFHWVNTILGNLKNTIRGSLHAIRSQHARRYLAEFEYRFNRRFDLPSLIERFAYVALRTPPMPYRLLKMADPGT